MLARGDSMSFLPSLATGETADFIDPLLRLKDALEGAQKNTHRMITKLEKFEQNLDDLEKKMQPIQESTKLFTTAKDNISMTLAEVNKTYEYFRVANTVKEVINKGIHANNQDEYYDALVKLSYAKAFFESHREMKSSASVLASIDELLQKAVAACTAELEKMLSSVGPAMVMENGQYQIVNPMPAEVSKQVKSICDTFESAKSTAYLKIYQQSRTGVIKASLKTLEAGLPSAVAMLSDDPYAKGSHPFHAYLPYSLHLLKGEFQLWGMSLPSSLESLKMFVSICDACVADLQRLLSPYMHDDKSSKANPVSRMCKLFLMRMDLFSAFLASYQDYRDICHPDSRRESSASLAVKALHDELHSAVVKAIEYLLSPSLAEGLIAGSSSRKQDDGSVCDLHPVTGNCLYVCKEMQAVYTVYYRRIVEVAGGSSLPSDSEEFCVTLLENLFVALEARAEKLNDGSGQKGKSMRRSLLVNTHSLFEATDSVAEELVLSARKHLFLCNNYYALSNYFRDRRDGKDRSGAGADTANRRQNAPAKTQKLSLLAEKIEARFHTEEDLFCESVAIALGMGGQDMADFEGMFSRDKAGQPRLLKAKFMVFNTGMEALLSQQGEWRVSSAGLREELSKRLAARIAPVYSAFHSTYSVVRFSKKHMDEYVKFSPQQVESHLKNFFGRV